MLDLLEGEPPFGTEHRAREGLSRKPFSLRRQSALALALLLQNRAAEALSVQMPVESDPVWVEAPVIARVVRACVLAAADRHEPARGLIAPLSQTQLRPGEQRLLAKYGLF